MTNSATPGSQAPKKGGMPKWLVIILVLLLIIIVGCCGGGALCTMILKNKVPELAENVANAAGIYPKKLPPNFPSDIPIYTGLAPVVGAAKGEVLTAQLEGKGEKAQVVSYYQEQMSQKGWTEMGVTEMGESGQMVRFEKGDHVAIVTVLTGSSGQVNVNITYGKKDKVEESD